MFLNGYSWGQAEDLTTNEYEFGERRNRWDRQFRKPRKGAATPQDCQKIFRKLRNLTKVLIADAVA